MTTVRFRAREVAHLLGQHEPTPEQVAVIESPLAPALVVAGAGSGKTETMSARVVWLIANGLVEPRHVLGLTFTKKAAHELAERIDRRLASLTSAMVSAGIEPPATLAASTVQLGGQSPRVATYNGFALDLVHEHALRIGIDPDFTVIPPAAAWQIAYDLVESWQGELPFDHSSGTVASAVLSLSGALSDHLRTPRELDEYLREIEVETMNLPLQGEGGKKRTAPASVKRLWRVLEQRRSLVPLLEAFAREKRERGAIDFSDQVSLAAAIAEASSEVREDARTQHRVVLLDEFQDTSVAQLQLLASLFGSGHATCAVGDPNQAIYGWRGASAASLSSFVERWGSAECPVRQYTLSTSWRNDAALLTGANAISRPLAGSTAGITVPTLAPRPDAGPGAITVAAHATEFDEATAIAEWISTIRTAHEDETEALDEAPPSAAVLVRSRSRIPALQSALESAGLSVSVAGGDSLLAQREVSDVRSLLEVISDASRSDALVELLEGPRFRLAPADIAALGAWRRALERSAGPRAALSDPGAAFTLVDAVTSPPPHDFVSPAGQRLSASARARLASLARIIREVRGAQGLDIPDLVTVAVRALGVDIALESDPSRDQQHALANIERLRAHAETYARTASAPSLEAFLAHLDVSETEERGLEAASTQASDPNAVVISTVHAAKGLEWDHVAIASLTEGSFPSYTRQSAAKPETPGEYPAPREPGWVNELSLATIPVELRGDGEILSELRWAEAATQVELEGMFEEFRLDNGAESLREERRLMYVALTRAKKSALLTHSAWSEGASKPRQASRFVHEISALDGVELVQRGGEIGTENPLESAPRFAQWPTAPHTREKDVKEAKAAVGTARASGVNALADISEEPDLALFTEATRHVIANLRAEHEARSVYLPSRLSPSDLVALSGANAPERVRELVRPMPRKPSTSARLGTRFHAWVEETHTHGALLDVDDLLLDQEDDGTRESLQELKTKFDRSIFANMTPLALEIPVSLALERAFLSGVIDAVYPNPQGEGVWIVDWKTGRVPSGEELARKALQLTVYRLAWHQKTGVPLENIETKFHYVAAERTVEITQHPREEELVELLAQLG
ncbi:ATP-dependent DNA helicase [Dermabacter vaginalis]|uniref:ATP-dependent DNA helicase n=1 Tax=Dermabacter vaginalis TaxID=1630135 RepID=UPI001CC286C8|nr:ATP-dependent DNA helicase [Dermabacter vaginalis]